MRGSTTKLFYTFSSEFLGLDTQFRTGKNESNVMCFECTVAVTSPYW